MADSPGARETTVLISRRLGAADTNILRQGIDCKSELIVDGNIGGIAAVSDRHVAWPQFVLCCVEGIPTACNVGLEPGVHIHRLESVQVADHQPCGDAKASTQSDSQVRKIAANARLSEVDVDSGNGHV